MPEQQKTIAMGQQPEMDIKAFPAPSAEELKNYGSCKENNYKVIALACGTILWTFVLIMFLIAFIKTADSEKMNGKDIGMLLVVFAVEAFIIWGITSCLKSRVHSIKAKVIDSNNTTATYEAINPDDKGMKKQFEIVYEYTNNKKEVQKGEFMILVESEKYNDLRDEIPALGDEIFILYDNKKHKVISPFLPIMKEFMKENL